MEIEEVITVTLPADSIRDLIEEFEWGRGNKVVGKVKFKVGYKSSSDAWGSSTSPVFNGVTYKVEKLDPEN